MVEYIKPEGIERYGEAAAVREEVFGGCSPTVNTVPVRALLRPDALIEVEVTAGLGDGNRPSGMVFLPTNDSERRRCKDAVAQIVADQGQHLLGWRPVPVDADRADQPERERRLAVAAQRAGQMTRQSFRFNDCFVLVFFRQNIRNPGVQFLPLATQK